MIIRPLPQSAHAGEPAVVIAGFVRHVPRDLRVRQDQEALAVQSLDDGCRRPRRATERLVAAGSPAVSAACRYRRPAGIAPTPECSGRDGDRQNSRQSRARHASSSRRPRRRSATGPRRRDRVQKIRRRRAPPCAAPAPARHTTCAITLTPQLRLQASFAAHCSRRRDRDRQRDAGIRAEQVDRPEDAVRSRLDQPHDVALRLQHRSENRRRRPRGRPLPRLRRRYRRRPPPRRPPR